jgi:glycosyltransferase involved in cell wall biosynthesis
MNINREMFDITVLCMEAGGIRTEALERMGVRVLVGDGTLEKIKNLIPAPDIDILHFHRSGHSEPLHNAIVQYLKPKKIMETNVFAFYDPTLVFDLQVYKSMMMLTQRVWKGKTPLIDQWKKQRVIYNPVTVDSFEKFRLSHTEIQKKRNELGIPEHHLVIGRIGRNDPVKWGDLLLSAWPFLIRKIPNITCILRTAPDSRIMWFKKHGFLNDNRMIILSESGDEREVAETYQLLDVYVHMSRRGEAFGNSLNEAMVWGLPIIVENTPQWDNGQVEQIVDSKTGYIVRSVGGLLAAIETLTDPNQRKKFGQEGRYRVTSSFGLNRGVGQYELAYEQLSAIVDSERLSQGIFPTPKELINFPREYSKLCTIDTKHKVIIWMEVVAYIQKIYWRIIDSLIARRIL